MQKDILEMIEEYIPDDPVKWGKLASEIHWRRLQRNTCGTQKAKPGITFKNGIIMMPFDSLLGTISS
jgi:hypothetical protein